MASRTQRTQRTQRMRRDVKRRRSGRLHETKRGALRDLIKRARVGEQGAGLVAADAMLEAGYSPERAGRALSHRDVPADVREAVRRLQEKQTRRREAARAGAAKRTERKPPPGAARKANDAIYDLIHNRYFQSVPIDKLYEAVERAGFHFAPEDRDVILTGRQGRGTWDLYNAGGHRVDHVLVVQWYRMESGRYEIVAYVS
jgi:hypothetical protein